MEKPQPVPGPEPGLQPPPYSGSLSSQSQKYTPVSAVPTAQMDSPHPTPKPQDTATCYNPVNQGLPENGKPRPKPAYDPTDAPTTYDPMANVPRVNWEGTHNQTVMDSSQPADIGIRARRCRYLMVALVIGAIVIAVGVGVGIHQKNQRYKSTELSENFKQLQREREAFERALHQAVNNYPRWQPQFLHRYQRMVHQDLSDYDIPDSNHRTVFDESIKLEKSNRQRRDLRGKKRFDDKKIQRNIRKKGLYRVKKYVR